MGEALQRMYNYSGVQVKEDIAYCLLHMTSVRVCILCMHAACVCSPATLAPRHDVNAGVTQNNPEIFDYIVFTYPNDPNDLSMEHRSRQPLQSLHLQSYTV